MKWNIVTDSSCDLPPIEQASGNVMLSSVPFIISVDEREFVDDETLDTAQMLDAMERSQKVSHTSCPTPQSWVEQFEKAEQCIAITISSELSSSICSANLAREMVQERNPHKKIAVLDSRSTGPELALCVEKILELIQRGMDFELVVAEAELLLQRTHVAFALSSFHNLVMNERMSRLAGFVAKTLGMWGIGAGSEEGRIAIRGKTRGSLGALSKLVEEMKAQGFHGGKVVISHCQNLKLAEKLQAKIQAQWADCDVRILSTRGLCSYYAERGGLILAY